MVANSKLPVLNAQSRDEMAYLAWFWVAFSCWTFGDSARTDSSAPGEVLLMASMVVVGDPRLIATRQKSANRFYEQYPAMTGDE
jgi:hypothetical protein